MSTHNTQANQEGVLDVATQQNMVTITHGSRIGEQLPEQETIKVLEILWTNEISIYSKEDFELDSDECDLVLATSYYNPYNIYWRKENCRLVTKGIHEGQYISKDKLVELLDDFYCTTQDDYVTIYRSDDRILVSELEDYNVVETECSNFEYQDYCSYVIIDGYGQEDWAIDSKHSYVYHGGSTYLDEDVAEEFDIRYYSRFDEYMTEEEYEQRVGEECGDGYSEHCNTPQYHHFTPRQIKIENNKGDFNFGLEIEKQDREVKVDICAHELHNNIGWCKEQDASLRDENGNNYKGFECVTPVYSLFGNTWKKDFDNEDATKILNAKFDEKCGGHFNLSSTKYSPSELFEGLSSFFPLLYALYERRINQDYCQAQKKDYMSYSPQKRTAIYKQSNRIEFRIFPAVRSKENAIWRIDLIKIFCKNINVGEMDVLKMMANEKSPLHKHLLKVYSKDEIDTKIVKYIRYTREFNNKNLDMPKQKKSNK